MEKTYELTLESDMKEVRRVQAFIKDIADEHHFETLFIHDITLIITEATNNAVLHGNKLDKSKHAHLICKVQDDNLFVAVLDEGAGFNPDTLPDPLAEENLLKPSGRGVFLIRQMAKDVKYDFSPAGTTVSFHIDIVR